MHDTQASDGGEAGSQRSNTTPRSLLQRVRAGEGAAWERLVSLYAPLVLQWCRRWDLQDQDAADVLQEVFQAVATHIASFRKSRDSDTFRGWLRTITRNKIHDHFRRLGREPGGAGGTDAQRRMALVPAPSLPEDDSVNEQKAERALFRRALEFIRGDFEERT